MRKIFFVCFSLFLIVCTAGAQIRKIPSEVTNAFTAQYPDAKDVSYDDNLRSFKVVFTQNGEKMIAYYNSKGEWKETEKTTDITKLPQAVQDGFQKSKYATEWKISEATIFYEPKNAERYRLKVEKGDVQRKYLHFNKNGRLLRDSITI